MPRPLKKDDHLYLVDGSTFIFRAYHALPPLTRKSDGLPVGALSGFCNMLYKLLNETNNDDGITHLAVIFDHSGKSFRNDIYTEYKAHRPPAPEDLVPQFPLIREAVRAFNVACVEKQNFEADDLIATYASQAATRGARVTIVSSDKDLMQLVNEQIDMLDTMKNRAIGLKEVKEKFGVTPDKVIDVQALAGDSVDNVPGVPGIGVKTAAELINTYGDLDSVLAHAGEIKQPKRRERLIEFADMARLSRQLVTLKTDVEVDTPLDVFTITQPEPEALLGFLREMELNTLTRRVAAALNITDIDAAAPPKNHSASAKSHPGSETVHPDPAQKAGKIDTSAYETITSRNRLEEWIARGQDTGRIAIDTETTSLDTMRAELVGISLATLPGAACYIPLAHGKDDDLTLDMGDAPAEPEQMPMDLVLSLLKPLLEDPSVLKIGQNIKYDYVILARRGICLTPLDDTMLLSYALDAGLHGHGMDALSEIHLGHKPIPFKEVTGTGKKKITFDRVPIDKATAYAAEDADITLRLHGVLKPRLVREGRVTEYETLERPLVPVLAEMEMAGVKVDRTALARLSQQFAKRMAELEQQAHDLAGEHFNLASPRQLGEILFEKMNIASTKKTKTGAYATGADVLEELSVQGHELPKTILEWRQLAKLKSTYTDALTESINPQTDRIHTSYSLAATSTGRLASSDPNLQNIPIRTEEGRQIRHAFIAEEGHTLVSADYSQIELRLLAHIADIDALKQAFHAGLDIHAMTASEIFGVPIKDMDPMVRRRAKAINFGIIYGISAFGLANQLGISRSEAQDYITSYFKRFPGIQAYMENTKAYCREHGFVMTLFGRCIHFPDINSKNAARRALMERAAINAPIQGAAADIIRRAMVRVPAALARAGLKTRMLLQVHDELVLEAPDSQSEKTAKIVSKIMGEAPHPALELSVPLIVDTGAGSNWAQAH